MSDSSTVTTAPARRPWRPWLLPAAAAAFVLLLGLKQCASVAALLGDRQGRTVVTHDVVVEKVQSVAKLVSSEASVRDVLIYRNTWYGSTKQSLVVVTAKLLAGIDLDGATDVRIDEPAKRITVTIPHATLLAVEVTDLRTYDEQRGLWNPFTPADRDAIFRLARAQLTRTAQELELTARAEESAALLLSTLLGADGWTAEVVFRAPLPPLDR